MENKTNGTESSENILSYLTLKTTIQELTKLGELKLADRISLILKTSEIPKPLKHAKKDDLTTSFYKIELSADELEAIEDFFLALESKNISPEGDTTSLASFYADLVDDWKHITPCE